MGTQHETWMYTPLNFFTTLLAISIEGTFSAVSVILYESFPSAKSNTHTHITDDFSAILIK